VKHVLRRALLAALFAVAATSAALAPIDVARAAAEIAATPLAGKDLLAALRRGGYVIYFRHAATDFGQNDNRMSGYEDCATQRNLSDGGRDEARAIGAQLEALAIPVERVLASPFCRTMETARLIFGRAESSTAVRGGPASAEKGRYADLVALLSTPLPHGTNLAIVSHGNPFRAVTDASYLAEGEAAIVEPLGSERFRVVARVRKDEWAALAGAPKPRD
jgi:phosphohistidine phosphatase SixA